MELFDFALYAAAILGVLWLRAETTAPAPVAPAPLPDVDLPPLEKLVAEAETLAAKPVPAMAAAMAAPAAIAVVEVEPVAKPPYSEWTSPSLRDECQRRGIRWRNARGKGKHLLKPAMIAALEALE